MEVSVLNSLNLSSCQAILQNLFVGVSVDGSKQISENLVLPTHAFEAGFDKSEEALN